MYALIQGILLAAGEGRRFKASHPDKDADKLLTTLQTTQKTVLATSASNLLQSLPQSLAVIQPHQQARQQCLAAIGLESISCEQAAEGMAYALAHAVAQTKAVDGWLIMLADMPWVSSPLINQLCQQLTAPDQIVLPSYQGQLGHPVLFGAHWRESLIALTGDRGAKALIQANPDKVVNVDWHDDSVLRDIDVVADLNREC